jgi:hypothetical protein
MARRKGRRRKSSVTLPPVAKAKRPVAAMTAAAQAATFSLDAALAALGPCPRRAVEAAVKAKFGRQRVSAAFREAARFMPEVALAFWRARPQLDLRQCEEVVRVLALEHPDFAAEVSARQAWIRRHDEIMELDRAVRRQKGGLGMVDVEVDRKTGLPVARFGNDRGTAERGAQEPLETVSVANSDKRSQPVTVARASNTLQRLLRSQTINRQEFKVAQRFNADFSAALFDRFPTMKFERLGGGSGDAGTATIDARHRVGEALRLLGGQGSDQGDLAWHVVGQGMSLGDWVVLRRMSTPRRLTPAIATGLLCGALSILHRFYFPETKDVPTQQLSADMDGLSERSGRAGADAPPFEQRLAEMREAERFREKVS